MRRANLVGQEFGRLTVISDAGNDQLGRSLWLCECECGDEVYVNVSALRSGNTASCGCLKRDTLLNRNRRYDELEAPYRVRFNRYRRGAEDRGYGFELSFDYWFAMTQQDCYWCGAPPAVQGNGYYETVGNGVDRYDNDLGYTEENCVTSCSICNSAKSDMPIEQWLSWLDRIRNYERR